ncbi:MAG: translation initiation factor IF-2 subunit beta [Nitrososphaerota archaeon]
MPDEYTDRESYTRLLDIVLAQVSKTVVRTGDRALDLRPQVVISAKNTYLVNLSQIAKTLNREPSHVSRFILKETGRAGSLEGDRLVIQGTMSTEELKKLLEVYIKEFVRCPTCGGIDTRILAEKRFRFLVCDACGAKNPVRRI